MAKKRKQPKKTPSRQQKRQKRPFFRLLPLTILMAFGLLCLKSVEVYQTGAQLREAFLVGNVQAEEEAVKAAMEEEGQVETKLASAVDDEAAATATEAEETTETAEEPPVDILQSREQPFSAREVDVLQSLSERRKKLDMWENEIALRENLLKATEERIDRKLEEMKELSEEIQELLVAYNEEEDAKIRSLVKVYEAMKPKEAARIFDELDMDVLLMVVDRMSERRVAPVLASMSPKKAKEVTQKLAEERKLNQPATNAEEPEAPLF